jgi:probable Rubsico expression protein CbbX
MAETGEKARSGFSMNGPAKSTSDEDEAHDGEAEGGEESTLDDDDTVNLKAERADYHIDDVLERLDRDLVGLVPVKARVKEIASLLVVDRMRRRFRLESSPPNLHMCFTGSPGTGKTTVAMRMAELLHQIGYIRRNQVVSVTRDDLVGEYIGHTAPKTREVLKRAMGGVLFIDEAYYLYKVENERDYGQETIEILLQAMERDREDLVVILAGYADRMDTFFKANPGMSSRIAHHIDFPDYETDELLAIGKIMLSEQGYCFSEEAEEVFVSYLERRRKQANFANARSVRNALERARLRHADRLMSEGSSEVTRSDLMRIEADDIRKSRVFDFADSDQDQEDQDEKGEKGDATSPDAES